MIARFILALLLVVSPLPVGSAAAAPACRCGERTSGASETPSLPPCCRPAPATTSCGDGDDPGCCGEGDCRCVPDGDRPTGPSPRCDGLCGCGCASPTDPSPRPHPAPARPVHEPELPVPGAVETSVVATILPPHAVASVPAWAPGRGELGPPRAGRTRLHLDSVLRL